MLGWHIIIHPRPEGDLEWEKTSINEVPVLDDSLRIACWGAGLNGLRWIQALIDGGEAQLLAMNGGYPLVYELDSKYLPGLLAAPPALREGTFKRLDESDEFPAKIIIEAWDES